MRITSTIRLLFASSFLLLTASACHSSSETGATEPVAIDLLQDTPRGSFSVVKSRTIFTKKVQAAPVEEVVAETVEVETMAPPPAPATKGDCPKPILAHSENAVANLCLTTERFAKDVLNFSPKQFARVQMYEKKLERRRAIAH